MVRKSLYESSGFAAEFTSISCNFHFELPNWLISPSEIEKILLDHPAVEEAVVVGVHNPEAFVVLKAGISEDADVIRNFVDNRVPLYNQLRGGLNIVHSLPKHTIEDNGFRIENQSRPLAAGA